MLCWQHLKKTYCQIGELDKILIEFTNFKCRLSCQFSEVCDIFPDDSIR